MEELLPLMYGELHAMAERMMRSQAPGHTLQPTALIHEAFVRLIDPGQLQITDRLHFKRLAARAMRYVLLDHAKALRAQKRGGSRRAVTLDESLIELSQRADDLYALDESLSRLHAVDERLAQIVEMRFFGGMTHEEIAGALETSVRTVERSWRLARAWLLQAMRADDDGAD